ncbi:hypothetical protein [Mesorhizobium sp. SP-1A]|uniref:hypothetical protein n=1 Tax=Mesorhizobium sp. SP-1A TaxID=3077840 RepID=UPI0028F6E1C5|nr:hypothetical protein [Mesorhizobium sp. SP-1A]
MANSQSVDGSARFSEYGAQRSSGGVDIADVLMSLQSPGERRQPVRPQQQAQMQAQLEPQPQSEKQLEPQQASVQQSCGKKAEVNFLDKGHTVTFGNGLNTTVYQKLKARGQTGGAARGRGLEYDVRISEEGCSKTVAIDVFRSEPIQVAMPVKNGETDCIWDRIYQHELEHVRITLTTPKSFEEDIRGIAENSTNPASEMIRLIWRIEKETARRHDQFHKFESRISPPRGCKPTFRNMTW